MASTISEINRSLSPDWLKLIAGRSDNLQAAGLFQRENFDSEKPIFKILTRWPAQSTRLKEIQTLFNFTVKKADNVSIPNVKSKTGKSYDFFSIPVKLSKDEQQVLIFITSSLAKEEHHSLLSDLSEILFVTDSEHSVSTWQEPFYGELTNVLAGFIEQSTFNRSLISLVAELTRKLDCERVALGRYKKLHTEVLAISNSSNFDSRTNLTSKISAAMNESIDQNCAVMYPAKDKAIINRNHSELNRHFGIENSCTLPMIYQNQHWGAVTLMRANGQAFNVVEIAFCEQALALATPYLALNEFKNKSAVKRFLEDCGATLKSLIGFRHLRTKLIGSCVLLLLLMTSFIETDFRISADAVLEGKVQRVIASPFESYVVAAEVRAGDVVSENQVLAQLDDSELKLAISRRSGRLQQLRQEYREARAKSDLVNIQLVAAQIQQSEAELQLEQQQLQQTQLRAPFDGVLIEGDLSEMLGSPVEKGQSLFRLAPLQGYRIILKVSERDISYVEAGQTGNLSLTSLPGERFNLKIEKITPAAQAENGENIFRIEATLNDDKKALRPGMEGVAKIHAGRAKVIWTWTREIWQRARLWLWNILP